MAVINRIKFDGLNREWIIYRYPGEDFVMGSQLIVGEGQVAVFVKGGRALDYFTAGTYTLSARNLPILKTFVNLPFGGKTPFTAEVYFINKTSKLDINWGTADPIQLIDPKYNIKLRVRAFGQFGLKVDDYRVFLTELIGTMNEYDVVSYQKLLGYFRGLLVSKVKALIAQAIIKNKISALEITASIDDISEFSKQEISEEFHRFGLRVVNFYIESINFPDEDFEAINKILSDKAAFDIIGDRRYVSMRSFDVLESAADNPGGVAGAFVGAGLGIGAGLGAGQAMGGVASQLCTAVPDGKEGKCPQCGTPYDGDDLFCANCGSRLAPQQIVCGNCGAEIEEDAKFCTRCGEAVAKVIACPSCNTENEKGTKFCKECGTKLEV